METRSKEIKSHHQPLVSMTVTPGHFATRHSHINYYVDLTAIKSQHTIARLAAQELASAYDGSIPVDTIICLDGTEVLAAFMAEILCENSPRGLTHEDSIAILTPEINTSGQLMFRDNYRKMIQNQNVLLLVAQATTGTTIMQAVECIAYYKGRTIGISALFSAITEAGNLPINSIFTIDDVNGYATYSPTECPDCIARRKIDALVNSYGYSKI